MSYLLVAVGSALGGMGRYWLTGAISDRIDSVLPWGTIAINVTGSFLIGTAFGILDPSSRLAVPPMWREYISQFLMIGVLGGYTTFSAFSLQTLTLMRDQHWLQAGANVLLSVGLCLFAVWLGVIGAQAVAR